jgi:hypothetical protein
MKLASSKDDPLQMLKNWEKGSTGHTLATPIDPEQGSFTRSQMLMPDFYNARKTA